MDAVRDCVVHDVELSLVNLFEGQDDGDRPVGCEELDLYPRSTRRGAACAACAACDDPSGRVYRGTVVTDLLLLPVNEKEESTGVYHRVVVCCW